jgi:hypothetical protein
MRAGECLFMGKSSRAAGITAMTDFEPKRSSEAFTRLAYRPLVTDWAMEALYHASIA